MRPLATIKKEPLRCFLFMNLVLYTVFQLSTILFPKDLMRTTRQKQQKPQVLSSSSGQPTKTLVHVFSPFPVHSCEEPFCPFDQQQSVTLASMKRALEKVTHTNNSTWTVQLAAITFPGDEQIVPSFFHHRLPSFHRSTLSEYPNLYPQKQIPFVQDIFDSLLLLSFDYAIYTNSDITLHEDFYMTVIQKIIDDGLHAFVINRKTVPNTITMKDNTMKLVDEYDLDVIYSTPNWTEHPGEDCYVFQRSILEQIDMGDTFLGFLPFSNRLWLQTSFYGQKNIRVFQSGELQGTYHLGDDRNWQKPDVANQRKQNFYNANCHNTTATRQWVYRCDNHNQNNTAVFTEACRIFKLVNFVHTDWYNVESWCHQFYKTKILKMNE